MILTLHVLFAGLWLGCVVTEVLFERTLLHRGRETERLLARLHLRVDLWVELPGHGGGGDHRRIALGRRRFALALREDGFGRARGACKPCVRNLCISPCGGGQG